ncbi:MAG TPA: M28 family peptidase [Gemmatimonadales bacterium]|nr:M28 family peptidase [Gemmatimonadales bacterium]
MPRWLPLLSAVLLVAPPLPAQTPSPASEIRRMVDALAADSTRGRPTPSRELDRAAQWAAAEFARLHLRPLGDAGGYLQHYTIATSQAFPESSSVALGGPVARVWRVGKDAFWVPVTTPGRATVSGPAVVLVGVPDSTRLFAGVNLRGAVVIQLAQYGEKGLAAPTWLIKAGERAGAAAWVLVTNRPDDEWAGELRVLHNVRTTILGAASLLRIPVVELRDNTLGAALAELGVPEAGLRPLPPGHALRRLPGVTVRLHLVERILTRRTAPNVVALLPGADSTRRGKYVVLSAHLDALGIGPRVGNDSIFNGAADDAVGCAVVIAAARALAAAGARPPGSIVFALFSGTERELWGSGYYVSHPPVPLTRTVADLNVESVGRKSLKDSLIVVGRPDSWLGPVALEAATAHPEIGLTLLDDPWPRRHYLDQSDHSYFRAHGVPALFLYNGPSVDTHTPDDNPDKIDAESAARVAAYLAALARTISGK